jgi:anti-sigma factor RsiW
MKRHDADLMAFADGELDERSSRELEDGLARDPLARGKLDALGELGDLVRGHLELSADELPASKLDNLWREIDKGITRDAEAEPVKAAPIPAEGSVFSRIGRWFERYRGHVLTGAVTAGAVAALALLLRSPTQPLQHDQGVATGSNRGTTNTTLVSDHDSDPAEIESLDTPDGTGTVFNLQDEDGSTTVIWVTPDDTVEGI